MKPIDPVTLVVVQNGLQLSNISTFWQGSVSGSILIIAVGLGVLRDHALRAIKSDLVLEAVARAESLDVTAEELGAEIGKMAQAYDRDPKELAKQLDRSGQVVTLAGDIIRSKALDILVERADITEESPEAAAETERPADGTEEQA